MPPSSYRKPPWAKAPRSEWFMVEIKDGVESAVHRLDQSCTLIGRAADQVHIALQHESVSRVHARVAFDRSGTPWLRDLASSHGVTVNKKRLPAASVGQEESSGTTPGTRGVVLYPGDILQFGASTRIFCVEGPQDCARGAIKSPTENCPTNPTLSVQGDARQQDEFGSDDNDESEADDPAHQLTDDTIPDSYRMEWESLKARRYKLDNIKRESERILAKDELSAGQERQLERNGERTGNLEDQIREKEAELYRKVFPDRRAPVHREGETVENNNDDDAFFDRTNDNSGELELDRDGETEQSLLTKWNNMQDQRRQGLDDLGRQQHAVILIEQKLAKLKAASDDDDVFFAQNELDLANDIRGKLQARQTILSGNLAEIALLLRIANPKLRLVGDTWSSGAKDAHVADASDGLRENSSERQVHAGPNEVLYPSVAAQDAPDAPSTSIDSTAMPPPDIKRQRVVGPTMMRPPAMPKRSTVAAMGTLASIASLQNTPLPHTVSSKKTAPETKQSSVESAGDANHDAWQAPRDQDGSGITKLNAKFHGRY